MFRAIVVGLTLLHLGPGFAFVVLAFGCDPSDPGLGELCRRSSLETFTWLTLGAWAVLLAGYAGWRVMATRGGKTPPPGLHG